MAPSRRKVSAKAAAAAAAAHQQWKIGDLVLAKMKGFPAWPAMISEPEKWGFSSDRKKLLVYFYGTKQIAFCNHADIEAFTEEKKKSLLIKRQGKGADFVRAVEEIIDVFESLKKQNLSGAISNDGENEGTTSNQEHFEDSRIDSLGKTVEPSLSPSLNRQLEGATVTECDDKLHVDDSPGSLLNRGKHNKNAVFDDSSKKISILDQLRQNPLSSRLTTRKRARDVPLLSSVTKITSSRRYRSSLVNNSCESQKSCMKIDAELNVGCSASIIPLEELTPKEEVVAKEHHATCSAESSPISTRVPLEDILAVKNEENSLYDENILEFSGKLERSDNEIVSNTITERDARLDSKAEIPLNTLEIKTRRNPYRKQVSSARACDEMDKEVGEQAEGSSLSDSSNSQNGTTDKIINADGDEHLPLVKRARVRMGKPSVDESLKESVGSKVKLDDVVNSNGRYESTTSSSPVKNCPLQNGSPKRTSLVSKEFACYSTNGATHNNTGSDRLSCKLNKYHLMLDGEAALPPSKRLHRALEAMSANAAEVATDCLQDASKTELKSSDCLGSSIENVHSGNASVMFPAKILPMQAYGTAAFDNSGCGLSSSLTSQNLLSCCLTSSEVKHEDTNPGNVLSSLQKNSLETVTGRSCDHGFFSSKITDTSQSSSFEFVGKHCPVCGPNHSGSSPVLENDRFQLDKECTYSEGARVSLKENNTCNSQQLLCSSPSSGAATAMSTTITVCTASETDDAGVGSFIVNVDSSASDINGIPSVSSATNMSSATNVCSLAGDLDGAAAASLTTNFSSTVNCISMATLSRSLDEQTSRVRDMQNVALEAKQISKDRSVFSKSAPIKDLIAAAQAKRFLSRSTSMCDSVIDGKVAPDAVVSPTLIGKEESSSRGSPSNPLLYHRPASDDGTCYLQNGSRTPIDGLSRKGSSKYMNHSEVNAARRCFESLLCTLSRTKDSIGRATRSAIDCAKYGIAGEVIDILLQYLEKESSLHRRVDLFFLVDSITQCSRCQKGGPGDVYPSLVQAVLPRLLTAAAPPGNTASENRRQCLKVLRLWLERKTLPEFTVRHHIRELEYESEASLCISYSRRPPRTERSLNDPVREMEGMLVDEYGSNASFQLPQFFNTRILEDEEGSASDDKGFEAVTPDRNAEVDHEMGMTPKSAEKHRHVLEDVDGELEMEDVAPPCGHEASQSTFNIKRAEMMSNCNHKCEQNNLFSFAPPLPEEQPPSPPPLPSSPPPVPPPCSVHASQSLAGLTADNSDFGTIYTSQNQLLRPSSQKQSSLHCSSSLLESAAFYSQGYVGLPQQFPRLVSSCTSSSSYSNLSGSQPAMPAGSNSQSIVNMPSGNKLYHLQPPPPVISNQFSYIHAQPQHRPHAPGNQSSYSDRFHHAHDNQRGFSQVDVSDRSTFYPSVNAASIGLTPDNLEAPLRAPALNGPHLDPSSAPPCQDWSYAPRSSSYTVPGSRQSLENPVSAPAYWRPR